jgi:hypothetical protein
VTRARRCGICGETGHNELTCERNVEGIKEDNCVFVIPCGRTIVIECCRGMIWWFIPLSGTYYLQSTLYCLTRSKSIAMLHRMLGFQCTQPYCIMYDGCIVDFSHYGG